MTCPTCGVEAYGMSRGMVRDAGTGRIIWCPTCDERRSNLDKKGVVAR